MYGGTETGYYGFLDAYIDAVLHNSAISLIRSGRYYYETAILDGRRNAGYYWDSEAYSENYARYTLFNTSTLYPQRNFFKSSGYSIRCLVSLVFGNSLPTMVLKAIRTYWLGCMGWKLVA